MQEIARRSHAACHSFFTVRRANLRLDAAFDRACIHSHVLHPISDREEFSVWQEGSVPKSCDESWRLTRDFVSCFGWLRSTGTDLPHLGGVRTKPRAVSSGCNCTAGNLTTRVRGSCLNLSSLDCPRKSSEWFGQGLQLPSISPLRHETIRYAQE